MIVFYIMSVYIYTYIHTEGERERDRERESHHSMAYGMPFFFLSLFDPTVA